MKDTFKKTKKKEKTKLSFFLKRNLQKVNEETKISTQNEKTAKKKRNMENIWK